MIAMKREVAALSSEAGFPWSECLEAIIQAKQTDDKSLYRKLSLHKVETTCLEPRLF